MKNSLQGKKIRVVTLSKLLVLFVFSILVITPFVFMFCNSFMHPLEVEARYTELVTAKNKDKAVDGRHYVEPTLLPDHVSLYSYNSTLYEDRAYLRLYWNSVMITLPILAGQLIISPLAAYGFEMMRCKFKETLFFTYIIVMLMPIQILMVPHYITAEYFGYTNTWWAIILPAIFAPFGTFLLRQQLAGFDFSLIEAARVEGASEWRIFRRVVFPLMKPSMSALAALTFVECWNIVDQAVVFIRDAFDEPLSVYLSKIVTSSPGLVFAASVLFMIPAFIIFLMSQDYIANGIVLAGGNK